MSKVLPSSTPPPPMNPVGGRGGAWTRWRGNAVLSLTPYEVGNALRKEVALRGTVEPDEARYVQEILELLFQKMEAVDPPWRDALDLAVGAGITFYDASHVAAAMSRDVLLVTDDERLAEKVGSEEFSERFGRTVRILSSGELVRRR